VDVAALENVIARISRLTDDLPEVVAIELNPVVVSVRGATVLGASARISADVRRNDTDRRGLSSC
jgi:hypothetical protein